jgi:hypothetical protein
MKSFVSGQYPSWEHSRRAVEDMVQWDRFLYLLNTGSRNWISGTRINMLFLGDCSATGTRSLTILTYEDYPLPSKAEFDSMVREHYEASVREWSSSHVAA